MLNQITRTELNKMLREYAIQDMGNAKEGGMIHIAQTLRGTVTLEMVDAPYEAYRVMSAWNVPLTEVMSEEQTIQFIMSIYDVSECEIID